MNKSNKTYKVGIYLRLSREKDGIMTEAESIGNQREIIMDYIEQYDDLMFVEEYNDKIFSSMTFERPEMDRMFEDCAKGKIDCIITKDISRLGRGLGDIFKFLDSIELTKQLDIRYISIGYPFVDTSVPETVEAAIYAIVENSKAPKTAQKKVNQVLDLKRGKGYYLGPPKPLYGYLRHDYIEEDIVKYRYLVPDEKVKHIILRIFVMFDAGNSIYRIADTLNKEHIPTPAQYKNMKKTIKKSHGLWAPKTIYDMLHNDMYRGAMAQSRSYKPLIISKKTKRNPKSKWVIIENKHEAIVPTDLFNRVQKRFELSRRKSHNSRRNSNNDDLLKGLLYCADCNHTVGINISSSQKKYCGCNFYKSKRFCTPHSIPYNELLEAIRGELDRLVS